MAGRSIAGQVTQIQKETTEGTAAVNAMLRVEGLRMLPGFQGDAELFRGLTGKMATAVLLPDLMSAWTVEAVQDFNAIGYVAASRIGEPVTTAGTLSHEHVYTLNPDAADDKVTYTAQFGDATAALQATNGVFNSMGVNVQRGTLGFDTGFIARELESATLATVGVTDVPAQPIPPRSYNVWIDDSWANLGTSKELAVYQANSSMGDKYQPDAPINSALTSFESLLEQEDQDHPVNLIFGLDAAALAHIATFKAGDKVYVRVAAIGPIIEAAIPYSIQLDYAAFITSVGNVGPGPASPATTIPMTLQMARESATEAVVLTLVNTVASY